MKILFATFFWFLLSAANVSAQANVFEPATPAGKAGAFDTSVGFSWMSHPDSASGRVGLKAAEASFTITLNSRAGVMADVGYAFVSHALGAPGHSDVLSYLGGPVFYPTNPQGKVRTDVHLLLGGARVSGPIPVSGGFVVGSWETNFAWAVGGGVEYPLSNRFGVRTSIDLIRTQYLGSSLTGEGQSNFRATAALVYYFSALRLRRRR